METQERLAEARKKQGKAWLIGCTVLLASCLIGIIGVVIWSHLYRMPKGKGACSPEEQTYVVDTVGYDLSRSKIIAELECDQTVDLLGRFSAVGKYPAVWFLIDVPGQPGKQGWVLSEGRGEDIYVTEQNIDLGEHGILEALRHHYSDRVSPVIPEPQDTDGLPDLVVGRFSVDDDCDVLVRIENIGSAAAPPTLTLRINDTIRTEELDFWLEPGEISNEIDIGHVGPDAHYMVIVDPNNEIAEIDEENNQGSSGIGSLYKCKSVTPSW